MSSTDPLNVVRPSNTWLNGIVWGTSWDTPASNQTIIYYNEWGNTGTTLPLTAQERAAYLSVFADLENIIDVHFVKTPSQSQADIMLASVYSSMTDGDLGYADPPGTYYDSLIGDYQSTVFINRDAYAGGISAPSGLSRGGYDYVTWLHEIGHALGLAHPHDTGGGSSTFPGVIAEFDSYGSYDMNQGVYTTMSYNDGWKYFSASMSSQSGWQSTMMALDVAALQYLYGANTTYASGNNNYILSDSGSVGASYKCIWDTGGDDVIWYGGKFSVTIDLRPATLRAEYGGGGFMTYVSGTPLTYGGFTIANGVVIEHAYSGGGNDTLVGNGAANALFAYSGKDTLYGLDGSDFLWGGADNDILHGGAGGDNMMGSLGWDRYYGEGGGNYFNLFSDVVKGDFDYFLDLNSASDRVLVPAAHESAAYFYTYDGSGYCYVPLSGGGFYSFGALGVTGAQLDAATIFC